MFYLYAFNMSLLRFADQADIKSVSYILSIMCTLHVAKFGHTLGPVGRHRIWLICPRNCNKHITHGRSLHIHAPVLQYPKSVSAPTTCDTHAHYPRTPRTREYGRLPTTNSNR